MMTPQQLVMEAKRAIREIDVAAAAAALQDGVTFLDVREAAEYEMGCIAGAIHISRGVLEFKIMDHPGISKDSRIVVYCRTGGRSALAAHNLQRLGFEKVESMSGGIEAWFAAGNPVATDNTRYGG